MSYDFHPIFVHFPIALLVIYTLMEIARVPLFTRQSWWFYTKAVLVVTGFIGGLFALLTGDLASEAYQGTTTMNVIRLHESFAQVTMIIYAILAASYSIRWMDRDGLQEKFPASLRSVVAAVIHVEKALFTAPVLILGSVVGFILLGIVGALGGAIVYGPTIDPIVYVVYHLFFTK